MTSLRQTVLEQIAEVFSAEAEYLFEGDDQTAVFRRTDNHKWFAILMTIPAAKLGLPGDTVDVMNVKGEPFFIASLHSQPGFFPAWHMNKLHWLTIVLDGTVPMEQIMSLTDMSYMLTAPKTRKRKTDTQED